MRIADRFGLSMGPLVLRVMLAATFIWAGLGKVIPVEVVNPADAARLAQMGVQVIVNAPPAPLGPMATPEAPPGVELPDPEAMPNPEAVPQAVPAAEPEGNETTQQPANPMHEVSWGWSQNASDAQPDDYPHGGTVRKLYSLALMFDTAANPGLDAESNPIKSIWPASLASGKRAKHIAWLVALTEIGFGLMLLLGIFTRFAALGAAVTMGTAAWLTVIGPAIQAGNPALGFLPTHDPFNIAAWQGFAWQLSLLTAALAVFFMGAGPIGLDRAIFRRRKAEKFELGPPIETGIENPEPQGIPGAHDMDIPRGPFDRSVEDQPKNGY